MKKRVTIIGGSIAGLTSALVLASAKNNELDFEINIIDEGKADLNLVAIYNTPLFPKGIIGKEIIQNTKEQINSLLNVNYISGRVDEISGSKGNLKVIGEGINIESDYIILATGANSFNIKGLGNIVKEHTLISKPNKIRLEYKNRQEVKEGIYVAGIASGVTSMVTTAMGSASEAACALLSDIKGVIVTPHDTPTSRK
ncbi:NAD(P)/FAD-dependent oxidoreductase [Helicobacter sp. MIT 14-3879]|uniref:NAD(P)/FAD-dependent oxidoreductase n=1 Tax=Helicobacter sp. MIT 14-3879 TaxID=2040649 RepID=UPI000E1E3F99|nr:NAD(P)/FAD-dependent oxidoreductase [Helicobacter sp. MIT 14-3879]RDU63130.1 NAD(P)/FAD-dependent oxidoreductase [Helicobacter sp. MIT 14-3879]